MDGQYVSVTDGRTVCNCFLTISCTLCLYWHSSFLLSAQIIGAVECLPSSGIRYFQKVAILGILVLDPFFKKHLLLFYICVHVCLDALCMWMSMEAREGVGSLTAGAIGV